MKLLLFISLVFTTYTSSIYSFSLPKAGGGEINLNAYQGKKILIVNVATDSNDLSQLVQLQQFYQQHSDNLVIIAVPSNSFGHEARSNEEIKAYFQNNYGVTFPIAAKVNVRGSNRHPLFDWLCKKTENGVANSSIHGDFQKFLISKTGELIGVFPSNLSLNHPAIQQALTSNTY